MQRMALIFLIWLAGISAALAQSVTVIGPITPGDCTQFNSTTVIKDAGTPCAVPVPFANPTAAVGLSAVNGSATSAMRSDAAPPLSSAVQTALTGTNNGLLFATGVFGFSSTAAPSSAGTLAYWNGTTWTLLAGNASGTNCLEETSAGVPSWGSCGGVNLDVRSFATGGQTFSTVCSGSGDDTATIQAAVNAASSNLGSTIVFPAGACIISTAVDFTNKTNVLLQGQANGLGGNTAVTRLVYTANTGTMLKLDGSQAIGFANLSFIYSSATYNGDLADLRQNSGSSNTFQTSFRDCSFFGTSGTGNSFVRMGGGSAVGQATLSTRIERCIFNGAKTDVLGGAAANNVYIANNWFNEGSATAHVGTQGEGWTLLNNTFEPTTASLCANITSVGVTNSLFIAGNAFNDCLGVGSNTPIVLTGGVVNGLSITGNQISGFFSVNAGSAVGVSIVGNALAANSTCNIIVSSASGGVSVLGNQSASGGTSVCAFPTSGPYIIDPTDTGVSVYTGSSGLVKLAASGGAPGAGKAALRVVAGTNAGTCKLIILAGTSTTASTVIDNVGSGC